MTDDCPSWLIALPIALPLFVIGALLLAAAVTGNYAYLLAH